MKNQRYHFIGIGGIGVSAVARILHEKGYQIQGSDVRESQLTLALREKGIPIFIGHQASNIDGADVIVYSTAVPVNNIERQEALRQGKKLIHRSEALAECLEGTLSIGITGTHGKGTVSAMITHGLVTAKQDPTFIIGGLLNQYQTNARLGQGKYSVAEVDESDGSHLNINPNYVVVNNIDVDHLNYYKDWHDIIDTMQKFIEQNPNLKAVALNADDAGVQILLKTLTRPVITYGIVKDQEIAQDLDFSARNVVDHGLSVSFTAYQGNTALGEIHCPIPGGYNAENAIGAVSILVGALGLDFADVQKALNSYTGLENRFTVLDGHGVTLVKDYLSHPNGMKKVLESAQKFDHHQIWCVFKPYRFTLMRYHAQDYAEAFTSADQIVITLMYAAEEKAIDGIDTPWFVEELKKSNPLVHYIPEQDQITAFLESQVKPKDLVIFFGGDDFFRMADAWAHSRKSNHSEKYEGR
jgi:UDP-N-acetylmuramate--alanine ligase